MAKYPNGFFDYGKYDPNCNYTMRAIIDQVTNTNAPVGNEEVDVHTVSENIIAIIKMRNNFWFPLKMVIFPILRQLSR